LRGEQALKELKEGKQGAERTLRILGQGEQDSRIFLNRKKINVALGHLKSFVGLEEIKEVIMEFISYYYIQDIRSERGLQTEKTFLHMAFLGNPGTGKTTVARVIGRICSDLDIISKGHLVEVDRGELVGEYIGHTAQKTKKAIQRALGGILFIDEAYSLGRGDDRDFGRESIDTIVKEMEDKRELVLIIFAGYPDEMKEFLKSNPGLASRVPLRLNFPDYNLEQLKEIANSMAQDKGYILSARAKEKLSEIIKNSSQKSNARFVRNILEGAIRAQALRLIEKGEIDEEELLFLQSSDIKGGERIAGTNSWCP